jgi:uncharacterized protein YhhL (DUF1145 family)
MSALIFVLKGIVLLLWAGSFVTLVRPFASPVHEILVVLLVVGLPAHVVETWLFARKHGGVRSISRADVVQIMIFGAPHLAAIKLRNVP